MTHYAVFVGANLFAQLIAFKSANKFASTLSCALLSLLFLVCIAPQAIADDNDVWQHQSYKESKRLPDLHHAVGVKLADGMQPPPEFVLKDGKLQCKTCHGLEKMAEIPYDQVNKKHPDFLRGGNLQKLEQFCFHCHDKKAHERPNIHLLLDERGEINKDNCLYCHEQVHDERGKPRTANEWKLRQPPERLCFACHLKTPHLNAIEHQEAKPDDDMQHHIETQSEKHGIVVPLSSEGNVMCISCHTPHAPGVLGAGNPAGKQVEGDVKKGVEYEKHSWDEVFQADKAERLQWRLWQGGDKYLLNYQRIKSEVLLRLPAKNGQLCLSCHVFER